MSFIWNTSMNEYELILSFYEFQDLFCEIKTLIRKIKAGMRNHVWFRGIRIVTWSQKVVLTCWWCVLNYVSYQLSVPKLSAQSKEVMQLAWLVFQLIAAYSTPPAPPAPPETPDFAYESASTRLDFKDSDMKRLSMEIERERWVYISDGMFKKDS